LRRPDDQEAKRQVEKQKTHGFGARSPYGEKGEVMGYSRERMAAMFELFLAGKTVEEIAAHFGTNIISARRSLHRVPAFKDANAAKYGCQSRAQLMSVPLDARKKYVRQRADAKCRRIVFSLSLLEWWTIWCDSGRWEQRGCFNGQYVMCRRGDIGPYAVGNVFIALGTDNNSESTCKKSGLPRGVSRSADKFVARRCFAGEERYLGIFETPECAHAAYLSFAGPILTQDKSKI
jgi:hypothetical protein